MKNKYIVWIVVVVVTIGLFVYVQANSSIDTKNPVVIGALFPLTGGLASYGEPAQKVAILAQNEINGNGGVLGRKLVLDFQDHACNPKTAVSAYTQQKSKGISIYTSVACSGTVLALAPMMTEDVLVGAIVTSPKITGLSPNVFRNWASDGKEAKLFADEIVKRGYKKVGVIYEETDYAKGLKLSLEKELANTGVVVVSESFASDATDMRTQVTKLKAEKLDMLFISPQTVTNGDKVLTAMTEQSFSKAVFVNDIIIKSNTLLTKYSDLLNGAIGGDFLVGKSAKFDAMLSRYKQTYGEDCPQTNICAAVYDNVYMLANAVDDKGYDGKAVSGYLKTINYDGVSGSISFDSSNDRNSASYALFVVKDGVAEAY